MVVSLSNPQSPDQRLLAPPTLTIAASESGDSDSPCACLTGILDPFSFGSLMIDYIGMCSITIMIDTACDNKPGAQTETRSMAVTTNLTTASNGTNITSRHRGFHGNGHGHGYFAITVITTLLHH